MPETIEAEVIEIDGVEPTKDAQTEADSGSSQGGPDLRGRVLSLDRRWWPLWLLLGVLAVILVATVGVVLGACYLIFSLVWGLFRFLIGGFSGGGSTSGTLRRG